MAEEVNVQQAELATSTTIITQITTTASIPPITTTTTEPTVVRIEDTALPLVKVEIKENGMHECDRAVESIQIIDTVTAAVTATTITTTTTNEAACIKMENPIKKENSSNSNSDVREKSKKKKKDRERTKSEHAKEKSSKDNKIRSKHDKKYRDKTQKSRSNSDKEKDKNELTKKRSSENVADIPLNDAGASAAVVVTVKSENNFSTPDLKNHVCTNSKPLAPSQEKRYQTINNNSTSKKTDKFHSTSIALDKNVPNSATEIDRNNKRKHSSSSDRTSSKNSSSSSRRERTSHECSKCYKRSKIRHAHVGVQCTPQVSMVMPINKNSATMATETEKQPVSNLEHFKYKNFFHIEVHTNGGASVVHLYQNELDALSAEQLEELANEFFELCFAEDENGWAHHVMGVVHDAARYMPDLLEHLADNYSTLTVKAGVLGKNSDIETCTIAQYNEQVMRNYAQGTFRYGPLHQISLVGKVHEEVGGYFPDLLGRIEKNPFLKKTMPWGNYSILQTDPRMSNDGPILWVRAGEQLVPTAELNTKTPVKRQR